VSKYSTAPQPVNDAVLQSGLERTLENLREAQHNLQQLVERLHEAAASYISTDLEKLEDADPFAALKAALAEAKAKGLVPAKKSLMPKYEPRELECDYCHVERTDVDYVDPFDVECKEMICPSCEATIRNRPFAPLADEEVTQ
jgi:hypothetical protein